MPTETFYKLAKDKQEKIINSAKKEFSRVPFSETSIKNIVEEAGIARGSFYQYFDTKEDLLSYIMKEYLEKLNGIMEKTIEKSNGDIFEVFTKMYDYTILKCTNDEDIKFYRLVFANIKANSDTIVPIMHIKKPKEEIIDYEKFNTDNLNIRKKEDIKIIGKILALITKTSIAEVLSGKISKKEGKKQYTYKMNLLKNGMLLNK